MNATVVQPQNASFACLATARPRPVITWSRRVSSGDVQLLENDSVNYAISEEEFGDRERMSILIVISTEPADAGEYTCEASNVVDIANSSEYLTVHGECNLATRKSISYLISIIIFSIGVEYFIC